MVSANSSSKPKGKRMKGSDSCSSPDENKAPPSKGFFRKIFKKKSANLSFHTPKEKDDEPKTIRRTQTVSEIPRPNPVFGQLGYYTQSRTPHFPRRPLFEFSTPSSDIFDRVNAAGNTGANQSNDQPLPAAIVRPAADFGAFSRSDGSNSIDSNEMSHEKRKKQCSIASNNSFIAQAPLSSRSSSLAGQVHRDPIDYRHERLPRSDLATLDLTPNKQTSSENGTFYTNELLESLMQKNEALHRENKTARLKVQEQEKLIAQLRAQLENKERRFVEEKEALIEEHKAELKQKDSELIEKELNVLQRLSLSTPLSEAKMPLGEFSPANSHFNRSNGPLRPQSLYINNTPNRPLSSHDLVGKERHRNNFSILSTQPYVSRSSSTTPDSGAVFPLSSSPHLIPLFRDLITYSFHLHNSSDEASKFTNDWLNNIRPQICSPHIRIAFAEILTKLDQMQNEDIEQILEQTNKLLNDCISTMFGLRRDLVELRKREDYNKSKKDVSSSENEVENAI